KVDWVINFDSPPPEFIFEHSISARAADMVIRLFPRYGVPSNFLDFKAIESTIIKKNLPNDIEKAKYYFKETISQIRMKDHNNKFENFCKAMQKSSINLQIYHDFGRWCMIEKPHVQLKAKYWVFEAEEKDESFYLNRTNFTGWKKRCS